MKKKLKINQIMTIIILLVIQFQTVSAADSPILEVSAENIYLTAGEINDIKIIFKNAGDYKIFEVEAFITSEINGIIILSEQHKIINEIRAGKKESYNPQLFLSDNLKLGAYTLSLTVEYGRSGSNQKSTIEVPIGIIIDSSYIPKITYLPTHESVNIKSGSENFVDFDFKNNWNKNLTNVEFTFTSFTNNIIITDEINSYHDFIAPGDIVTVGSLITITESTQLGTYNVNASVSYNDVNGTNYYQTFKLPINVNSASTTRKTVITIDSMEILQERIKPGDIFNLKITIDCSGADAYNILSTISFDQTSPISPISPTTVSLGDLSSDQQIAGNYQLLASGQTPAGQYQMTATISYIDNKGQQSSLVETFTILIDQQIEFSFLDVPSIKVPAGERSEIEADLLLIGTEGVQFVSLSVINDNIFERITGSDEYIGAVDPDSPIPFDLQFKVGDEVPSGVYDLGLEVSYRDHLNREHVDQLGIEIEIGDVIPDIPEPQRRGFWFWLRRLFGFGN
jgi:hypothetical protein